MTGRMTTCRLGHKREPRLLAHARCCALAIAALLTLPSFAAEPPNIVFILADDLGWSDLGCYGSDWLETPRLDRLATEGLRFTNAYAPAPICSASRAATLTGRTTARNKFEFVTKNKPGRQDFGAPMETPPLTLNLDLGLTTIPELLKKADYETAFFGKWHLNQHYQRYLGWSPTHGPKSHGFDTAVEDFGNHPYSYWGNKKKRSFLDLAEGDFGDDSMTDRAADFVKQDHENPFFLMISHFYVHDPNHTRLGWLHQRYLKKIHEDHPRRDILAHYGAMVTSLDHHVGELLDAIEEADMVDTTLVVFTSDNGGHPNYAGNDPLRGSKWNLYEGGIRVPMIARWPGAIPEGTTTDTPVIGYDLLPTFAELADLTAPENIDGRSLATTLRNPDTTTETRPLFWHFPYYHPEGEKFTNAPDSIGIDDGYTSRTQPQSAIRDGNWKLIHFHEDEREELYRIDQDPSEQNDLSGAEAGTRALLKGELFRYLEEVDARLPTR